MRDLFRSPFAYMCYAIVCGVAAAWGRPHVTSLYYETRTEGEVLSPMRELILTIGAYRSEHGSSCQSVLAEYWPEGFSIYGFPEKPLPGTFSLLCQGGAYTLASKQDLDGDGMSVVYVFMDPGAEGKWIIDEFGTCRDVGRARALDGRLLDQFLDREIFRCVSIGNEFAF